MAQLTANGLQIEYDTFGKSTGKPTLLIMGLGAQMTVWAEPFCEALAAHGHYVIRFDNRDVGLSTKLDQHKAPGLWRYTLKRLFGVPIGAPYALSDMANDAVGVLEALGVTSAHIIGASLGGMVAQLVAVNHPQRVASLTSIMSTSGDPKLPSARSDVAKHMFFSRPDVNDRDALLAHTLQTLKMIGSSAYPRSDAEWKSLVEASMNRSYYPQGFARQLAAAVADGSRVERLRSIDRPTLVIHGKDDPLIPVECGIDTARHIAAARLEIIDGMGHDLPPQLYERLTGLIAAHARAV